MGWVVCGGLHPRWWVWGGLGGMLGGTEGGTLGGAWGSLLCCRPGSCTVVCVSLVVWVGFGGAPVAAEMSASFRMVSMVWAPKRAKGAAGAGFARASDRRLSVSMAASAEDMAGMAPLCGKI